MLAEALEGGFADPQIQSAYAFRAIMNAMARPGSVQGVAGAEPPQPISVAAGCVLLTLCDHDTPLFLAPSCDSDAIRAWLTFHTGAPICEPGEAQFALGRWSELDLDAFRVGTAEYPDRSTTVIVERSDLSASGATLSGPGIQDVAQLSLPETSFFQENRRRFPLGLDFVFSSGTLIAALPRSTEVR